jgi:hypothetical protein
MDDNKSLDLSSKESIAEFIQQPAIKIAEFLTGVLASDSKDFKLAGARIVQSAFKFNLLTQFGRELRDLSEKGKIKEDYFATNKQQATLVELLKFIDEEAPDEEIFKAMKSIFFTSIKVDAKPEDSLLAYELLQLCKKLKSADIILLKNIFRLSKTDYQSLGFNNSASTWIRIISAEAQLPSGLIEYSEENLVRLKLLDDRIYSDRSGVNTRDMRLTDLGFILCNHITNFPE